MKRIIDLKTAAKNAAAFSAYFCLTFAGGNFLPVSLALLAANLYIGFNPFSACLLAIIPYLFSLSPTIILSVSFGAVFLSAVFFAFSRYGKKPKFLILYMFVALLPYAYFTDFFPLHIKIALLSSVLPLPYVFISAAKVFIKKGLKFKLSTDEAVAAAALIVVCGYGTINVFGEVVWKQIGVFFVLLSSAVAPYGYGVFAAFTVAVPLAVSSLSFTPIAIFTLYFIIASVFAGYSRLLSAIALLGGELLLYYFTSAYAGTHLSDVLFMLIPVCAFVFIPEIVFKKTRKSLSVYRTATVGKYAVNRNRAVLSAKLFDVAAVFDEMAKSIDDLSKTAEMKQDESDDAYAVEAEICLSCKSRDKCNSINISDEILKTVNLGKAKGKINYIDLPKKLGVNCVKGEKLVDVINSAVENSRRRAEETAARIGGREVLKYQAEGLSEALKGLASSLSKTSEFDSSAEKALRDNLIKCGIYPSEILVYEGDEEDIDVVIPSSAPEKQYFLKAIDEAVGYKTVITDRVNLSFALSAVTLKKAPALDAAFGIAKRTKDGETHSGDTHSITKISESKFLIALGDGMGSGEKAMNTSAISTALIETFYRSGLPSKIILSIVNKLLAFDREDNFTAMDIGVVDLYDGSADFIKVGSPYSFVITKDSVKIIEGNSLPLGILDEIKPTVLSTALSPGDMIVLISDGVADAFGSASDVIEFLSTQRALNPKTLADDIISKAVLVSGGKSADDMTAFCVRLFAAE